MLLPNRSALIVGLAQPYVDWAAGLDEEGIGPPIDSDKSVYLIPDFEDEMEADEVLELVYEEVFESELFAWCHDEATWPQPRTLDMFRKWFDFELIATVEDLGGEGLDDLDALFGEDDDLDDDDDGDEDDDDQDEDLPVRH